MQALKLCRQNCPEKLPNHIDIYLGDGADGEVYTIENDPTKVLKFGILFDYPDHNPADKYREVNSVLSYLYRNPSPVYAQVYSHVYLGQWYQPQYGGMPAPYVLYYYSMERLKKLSEDERKVFHSILSHEDRNIEKNYSSSELREILQGMERGLDFNLERVISFCISVKGTPINHNDIHPRNIMTDIKGNYKLIDFDRAILEKL